MAYSAAPEVLAIMAKPTECSLLYAFLLSGESQESRKRTKEQVQGMSLKAWTHTLALEALQVNVATIIQVYMIGAA
jgi:hypothetical protein